VLSTPATVVDEARAVAPPDPTPVAAAAPPVPVPSATAAEPPPAPPPRLLPDAAVQYLEPPRVEYPRLSQRRGETGLTLVRAYIGTSGGLPLSTQVEQSSGHARLDQAALAAVKKARFKPYAEAGRPVEGWVLIPIRFELEK
jgi:protein TonB